MVSTVFSTVKYPFAKYHLLFMPSNLSGNVIHEWPYGKEKSIPKTA